MTLEQYRIARKLTYRELAEKIGASNASRARIYALGIELPRAARLQQIIKATGGEVTFETMYEQHRLWRDQDRAAAPPSSVARETVPGSGRV